MDSSRKACRPKVVADKSLVKYLISNFKIQMDENVPLCFTLICDCFSLPCKMIGFV